MSKNEPVEARAWDAVKADDDPTFFKTAPDHQRNLRDAAADVVKTKVTINEFERKVLELHTKEVQDAPKTPLGTSEPTPLGTTNGIGEPAPKAKTATAEAKTDAPKEVAKPKAEVKDDKPKTEVKK